MLDRITYLPAALWLLASISIVRISFLLFVLTKKELKETNLCKINKISVTTFCYPQVSNWFINARVRLWKPMIEDMYAGEVKQQRSESEATTQNPTSAGDGVAVKAEHNATAGAMGGESHHHFRSATL
jgi:hypothetical protein